MHIRITAFFVYVFCYGYELLSARGALASPLAGRDTG